MQIAAREMVWGGKPIDKWWLCFTAEQDNSTVAKSFPSSQTYEISTNGMSWKPYTSGAEIRLSKKGNKVYFRAGEGGNTVAGYSSSSYYFRMSGKIAASGSVMSLLNGEEETEVIENTYAFGYLFYKCVALTTAPELPAMTLADYCYSNMFRGCTNLVNAPELPATELADYCYSTMFYECTSLARAPELPATELANNCYRRMFYRCTSLVNAPELPATKLAENCYTYMFQNCTNLRSVKAKFKTFDNVNEKATTGYWLNGVSPEGVFECYSELGTNETIARGISACPEGWTVVNEKSVTEYVTIDTEDVHSFEWTPTGFIDHIDNYAVTVPSTVIADILVVGGGGAGANPGGANLNQGGAGGGGAGGMVEVQGVYLEAGSYDIVVGRGGISPESQGVGGNGESSKILFSGAVRYEAIGGGGGGIRSVGSNGGSGGGGSSDYSNSTVLAQFGGNAQQPGSIFGGYGNNGGLGSQRRVGGGGGGAGGPGEAAVAGSSVANNLGGAGGPGRVSSITGVEVMYAAGGGGGSRTGNSPASGGSGIGGNGGCGSSTVPVSATDGAKNTGSGGGGGRLNERGGDGGSGIVIIRIHKVMPIKPNAAYEFSYDGENHLLYEGGCGVTITKGGKEVSEIAEKDVGTYNYTVTLKDGYKWADLTENKTINVTVTVSVPSIQ